MYEDDYKQNYHHWYSNTTSSHTGKDAILDEKELKAIIEQLKTESASAYTNSYTSNTIAIDDSENIGTLKKENEKLKEQNKILKRYMTRIQGII